MPNEFYFPRLVKDLFIYSRDIYQELMHFGHRLYIYIIHTYIHIFSRNRLSYSTSILFKFLDFRNTFGDYFQ